MTRNVQHYKVGDLVWVLGMSTKRPAKIVGLGLQYQVEYTVGGPDAAGGFAPEVDAIDLEPRSGDR